MNDPEDEELIDQFAAAIESNGIESYFELTYKEQEDINKITVLLDLLFSVLIGIMMFLCFFSLSASMTANLYE